MFAATLSSHAQATLALLGNSGLVRDAYLAGGSALALHFGHRFSIDFDFFSQKAFNPTKLSLSLSKLGRFEKDLAKGISLIGKLEGVRLSYFRYDYNLIEKTTNFLNVSIAHPADIAAMKLAAVMDRGTKKDFIDIYELVERGINIETMFGLYEKKYGVFEDNRYSLIKSLQYFDDAQKSEMPNMIRKISWDQVKDFFAQESMRLAKKYIE